MGQLTQTFMLVLVLLEAVKCTVTSNIWLANVNDRPTDDDVPSKVTAKIGEDLTVRCRVPDYELKFFSWFFCQSDCRSSPTACVNDSNWGMVVKVDYGNIQKSNPTKFTLDSNGSLIVKDIQPNNDHNWVRCCHKERFVGQDHRSTIIRVAQEPVITSDNRKQYVVFENMPFVMLCEVKGYPPPWVAWIRKDQVLQNETAKGPNYLVRPRATTEEAGIYTCMAGNFAGVTSFNYQLTVRVDGPPGESTALTQTHSTVESLTAEPKATSQTPRETKGLPETPSTGTTRKADQKSISPGALVAIGFSVFIVFALVVTAVWRVKRRRVKQRRVAATIDNEIDGAGL